MRISAINNINFKDRQIEEFGEIIGPPSENEYAVEPVEVLIIAPSP